MAIADYIRVPKSVDAAKHATRWYMHKDTGEFISRWQMQTMQAGGQDPRARAAVRKEYGITSIKQAKINRYNQLAKQYKLREAARLGTNPRKIKVRGQSESAKLFRKKYKAFESLTKDDYKDKSPHGKLAQVLVSLGLRNPEWDMPVGESPK